MTAVSLPPITPATTSLPNSVVGNFEGLTATNPAQGTEIATESFMALLLSGQQIDAEVPPITDLATGSEHPELNSSAINLDESFLPPTTLELNEIKPIMGDNPQLIEQYKINQAEETTNHYLTNLIEIESNIQPLVAEMVIDEEAIDDANNDNEDKEIKEAKELDENNQESLLFCPQENPLPIKQRHVHENNLSLIDADKADKNSLPTGDELISPEIKEKNFPDLIKEKQRPELTVKNADSSTASSSMDILQNSAENLSPTTAVHIANANKIETPQLKIPDKAAPAERLATITDSISEQVLMQIERLADDRQAKQGIKVQLYPKELGEIVVHMRMEDNGNTVFEITSNKASSLQLLQLSNLEEVINKNSGLGDKCTLHMGLSQQDLGQNNRDQHQNQQNNSKKEVNNLTANENITSSAAIREYYSITNNSALNIAV
jgi:flagellar hook-length control protein FliK